MPSNEVIQWVVWIPPNREVAFSAPDGLENGLSIDVTVGSSHFAIEGSFDDDPETWTLAYAYINSPIDTEVFPQPDDDQDCLYERPLKEYPQLLHLCKRGVRLHQAQWSYARTDGMAVAVNRGTWIIKKEEG